MGIPSQASGCAHMIACAIAFSTIFRDLARDRCREIKTQIRWGAILSMEEAGQNVRVAILGGGAAALSAAFALTERGGYEVTVYQMGWRLGGECARGRRIDDGSPRDQEHG